MNIVEFLARLSSVKKTANGWQARCPGHDDAKASLSVSLGQDDRVLLKCFAGCAIQSIVGAMGLKLTDLFPPRRKDKRKSAPRIVSTYDYTDENGKLLFQSVRYVPKDFKQRRPDPAKPGEWIWNLKGVRRVLYRLSELQEAIADAHPIYIVEGEKDVDVLVNHGFVATCNSGGAGKWRNEYSDTLRGAVVAIIADKDQAGRAHARGVANALHGIAKSVKLIELSDVNSNAVKDAADFFAAGGYADDLHALMDAAPGFIPAEGENNAWQQNQERVENENPDEADSVAPARNSAATRLVKLADEFAFFHDTKNQPFVRLDANDHVEVWPVNSSKFRDMLARTFYRRTRTAINRNALGDAVAALAGRACYDGPEEPVFLRVAPHGKNILIDLCDPQWRVVEVTPTGWQILEKSPVAFYRTSAMRFLPLPVVAVEGSLDPLWELINVSLAQRPLVAGALLNGFDPNGPYFVTNFVGEQGTAKSCATNILRRLIDPNENPLRSPPREERDLLVQAANNRCVVLDNLSALPPWLSDSLCRLATGGGHSARQLYSDGEEYSLSLKRPVILNGIEDVAARPDLAERALQIELETISDDCRISEKELWEKFEAARPVIFSAILNGLVQALRELPNVQIKSLPRMADAALFATAGETAFGWPRGTFIATYSQNLNEGAMASLDAHPIGVAIRQLLEGTPEWTGEAAQLLKVLTDTAAEELRHAKNWPKTPRTLSVCLRRLAQAFRRTGIDLAFGRSKRRMIRLYKGADFATPASSATHITTAADANDANDAKLQTLHGEKPLVEEFA